MVSAPQEIFIAVAMLYCVSGGASCRRDEFQCRDGEKCIQQSYLCDGIRDCGDSSDEESGCSSTRCPEGYHRCPGRSDGNLGGTRAPTSYTRRTGYTSRQSYWQCLKGQYVCDGTSECWDGSDEKDCGNVTTSKVNEFRCSDGKKGIPMRLRCNCNRECADGSDETDCGQCPERMRSCDSGQCVREWLFCNGQEDCMDGSDEEDCGYEASDIFFLNEGPNIYIKKRTRAGLEFTHLLPIAERMKRTGLHNGIRTTGLAFDVRHQNLFISDVAGPAIIAVNVTSLDWRYLVNDSISSPMDVAFDWFSNNVYWVDSGSGTAEVVSVVTLRRSVVVSQVSNPVSIALSPNTGFMFVATSGFESAELLMYRMTGGAPVSYKSVQGSPASLAVHPTQRILFWTDPGEGTISYVRIASVLRDSGPPVILRKKIEGVMAVTVTERDFYFTSGEPLASERAHRGKFPGFEKEEGWKSITYGVKPSGKSECFIENGGCEYLCLTSETGKWCRPLKQ